MSPSSASAKNQQIQALRGIAIIMVMAQHMNGRLAMPRFYPSLFHHLQFWPGVDIFFAISGYLICGNFLALLRGSADRRTALGIFARRRFWRLMPALGFWMGASVLLAAAIGDPWQAAKSAVAALLGVSNFYWHGCLRSGVSICGSLDFNSVSWSLSLEFQLYALLCLLLALLRPRWAMALLLGLGVLGCLFPPTLFSLPWLLRPGAFALGALASQITLPPRARWIDLGLLAGGLVLAVIAPHQAPAPLALGAVALAGFLCLLSCLPGSGRALPPLVWVGERSYSLYLCHLPVILLAGHLGLPWFVAPVLALGAADLSYRLIEQRYRRH